MTDWQTRESRALIIALLASLALWNLPFGGYLLYPFKLFATWLHESSHGLVMLLTGAGFDRMEIYKDTSGLAYAAGPVGPPEQAAIASAGYMGTALAGAVFLVLGRTRRGAGAVLAGLSALLALSAALFVRNRFGAVALAVGALALLAAALLAGDRIARVLVNFVAVQACINAVLDIRVLLRTNMVVNGEVVRRSDAHNMAAATFGPAWLWAVVWLLWSLACFYVALRLIGQPVLARPPPAPAPAEPT